jgi:UDP-glucose 4-epimerase
MGGVLVTGARGAIGRAVVGQLKSGGHTTFGLGHGDWNSEAGLPEIDGWLNAGVTTDTLQEAAKRWGRPETIVHLAGGSAVGPSVANPPEDFRRTVLAGQALLDWVRTESPATRVVVASSAAVYGSGHTGPITETSGGVPDSPYGTHKAMLEALAVSRAAHFGIQVAVVRLFSVYGPGLRKQLVWELTRRLVQGERDIVLGGTGAEARDFVTVDDAAAMLVAASSLAAREAPVLNGCSGVATSVRDLAERVAARFDGVRLSFNGIVRPGDPSWLVGCPDQALAAGLPMASPVAAGIDRTVSWIMADMARQGPQP